MKYSEKINSVLAVLTFIIAFLTFTLSDSFSRALGEAELIIHEENVSLKDLGFTNGFINIIHIQNLGTASSEQTTLSLTYVSEIDKIKVFSDMNYQINVSDKKNYKISLERFPENSSVKVMTHTDKKVDYKAFYIDKKGKHQLTKNRFNADLKLFDISLVIVMLISIFWIFYIFKRSSETKLSNSINENKNNLQDYQNGLISEIRALKDDINNIEIIINDSSLIQPSDTEDKKGMTFQSRLVNFINQGVK
jgi:hypothetical protein